MKLFAWVCFFLVVVGVIFYDLGKLAIVGVLVALAFSVVGFFTYGIVHELKQPKPPDPLNPSADEYRSQKHWQERALAQAKALRTIPSSATDEELALLRRLAGLQ